MEKLTIRQWRRIRDLSQAEMASQLGVHINTYRHMEQYPSETKLSTLLAICNIMDIGIDNIQLETVDDDMNAGEE